ncbi:MAG: DUF5668 domain-containing protein [Bacteroidota bacterium]|nr:DUF5668 domain-containing protein [Bacteroidota bacterium]
MTAMQPRRFESRFIIGGILVLIGTVLMLHQLNFIYIDSIWKYWPLIFTLVGAVSIANALNAKEFGSGLWWIFFGIWLYVSINHLFGLSFEDTWPALLIAWGASIIWKSYFSHSYRFIKG